jgi:hypothetical protein
METKIFEVLTGKINDQIRQHIESLSDGAAKDYAEYRELVGVIRGLDHANLTLQDFAKRMEQLDNE